MDIVERWKMDTSVLSVVSAENNTSKKHIDKIPTNGSVGVLVVSDGRILTGIRKEGFEAGTICGPGGHVEVGETHKQAAIRETQEEFGITPKDLVRIGYGAFEPDTGLKPIIYMATDYEGDIANTDGEMGNLNFRALEDILNSDVHIFKPFGESLNLLIDVLDCPECKDIETVADCPKPELMTVSELEQAFNNVMSQNSQILQKELTNNRQNDTMNMQSTPYQEAFRSLDIKDVEYIADVFGTTPDDIFSAPEGALERLYESMCDELKERVDGGPGSGRYPKGSGGLSKKEREKISKRIVGQTTSQGVKITKIGEHAFDRVGTRKISPGRIEKTLKSNNVTPGNTSRTSKYWYNGGAIVVDDIAGVLVTYMWTGR